MSKSPESTQKSNPSPNNARSDPRSIPNTLRRGSSNRLSQSYIATQQVRTVSSPEEVLARNGRNIAPREPVPFTHPYGLSRSRAAHPGAGSYRASSTSRDRRPPLSIYHNAPSFSPSLDTSSSVAHTPSDICTKLFSAQQVVIDTPPPANTPVLSPGGEEEDIFLASNIIYERQLLQKKHGFPLWIPHPNARLPKSYTDKGVSVGDVGIVTPYGAFDYLFNVCLHAEHPNNSGSLPEGFVPLLIQQKDICETPEHGSGSFLCSSSVSSIQNIGSLSFQSLESEGAVLTMPEGAIHEDVRNLSKFREYAAIHAPNWYKFANGVCGREIENGELHLVTGCDKTTSWGMATFSRLAATQDPSAGPAISLDFVFNLSDSTSESGEGCVCSWAQAGNAEVKANSNIPDTNGTRHRNQCTFFRSHTVTLSEEEWMKIQQAVSVGGEGYASDSTSDTASRTSNVSKNAFRRLFSSFSQKSSSSQKSPASAETRSFTDLPRRTPHPSCIINKLLLQKYPRARVAITHDEEWALLIPDPTKPLLATELWEDIQLKFDVVADASGSVYLALKEAFSVKLDQKSILTNVELPSSANTLLPPTPHSATALTPSHSEKHSPHVEDLLIDVAGATPESLIDSIMVSQIPSTRDARLLVKLLTIHPAPPFTVLQRALFPLFSDAQNPEAGVGVLRTLGFDVMTAYWQNPYVKDSSEPRMTSDRLSCFTFFLEPTLVSWSLESWRSQFKAFQAVTNYGTEIKGIEAVVIDMLKRWLLIAFQWLVQLSTVSEPENTVECEQCVEAVGQFLVDILRKQDNVARIYDEALIEVLRFHSSLLDQLILIPRPQSQSAIVSPVSPSGEKSLRKGHKKRASSSLSLASIVFAATPTAQAPTPTPKPQTPTPSPSVSHPAELAISLFIEQLSDHLLNLKASQLMNVLPPLFRALAWCASPLPRLTLHSVPHKAVTLEDRIVELLNKLVPSASFPTCMRALKLHLFPVQQDAPPPATMGDTEPGKSSSSTESDVQKLSEFPFPSSPTAPPRAPVSDSATPTTSTTVAISAAANTRFFDSLFLMIMTSLGASRTLRNFVRKALATRSENASYSQGLAMDTPTSRGATASNRSAIDQDLLDVVWLRHRHPTSEQPISSMPKPTEQTLASSIDAWIAWDTDLPEVELHSSQYQLYEKVRDGREHILEEEAGILKDIYQEFDSREEAEVTPNETELEPVNDALKCLATYLVSLQSPDGTPFIVNAFQPLEAPTQLLHVITTLLSRDFSKCTKPLLAKILVRVCEHVTDENTSQIPTLMMKYHYLSPISPQWIANWEHLLSTPTLLDMKRPLTRNAVIDTLNSVYFDIKDMPTHRQTLAELVIASTPAMLGPEFCNPLWGVLEDDAVTVVAGMVNDAATHETPPSIRLLMDIALSQPDSVSQPALRTLINIFCQISFSPISASQAVQKVSLKLFVTFVRMLTDVPSIPCRLMLLQFLMRLRADRNHHVYLAVEHLDTHGLISYLSSLINRVPDDLMKAHRDEILEEHVARAPPPRQARPRPTISGMKVPQVSQSSTRPRAHTTMADVPPLQPVRHVPLWQLPEALPFRIDEADAIKGTVISYDLEGPDRIVVLPVSKYLHTLATLIETDPSWELVSYILCYLPTQLSNKHLFCGPNTRASITKLLLVLSTGIIRGHLADQTAENCPENLKLRDLQGLAQHTLSTMISYRGYFDLQQRQLLLDAYQTGLNGPFSTIKCALHALTLTAYAIPHNLSKALPQILEKLSQIMSNPNMAVHILAFLNTVGTLPSLYASFTEDDFKMVFGVALQYLQHYNQLRESPTRSWALSQHVRQQSYCAVYTWFVVLKLPDRQRHIPYITRQLLLANEGKEEVDGLTQVCFDWLARNTYGMTNAKATVHDIVLLPNIAKPENHPFKHTWVIGHMFLSIRPTHRPGWFEFMARRPSGSCSLVCRRQDFVNFAKASQSKEIGSFLEIFEQATKEMEVVSSPVRDAFTQETIMHPSRDNENDIDLISFAFRLLFHLSPNPPAPGMVPEIKEVTDVPSLARTVNLLDKMPVIDTHKVGILYVAPGQTNEADILRNAHGSQAYSRFLDGLGKLIKIRTEKDFYTGALDPDEDGEYHYAWGDDIRQILFHTATLMPVHEQDPNLNNKKRHIGNDYVRIIWNDSGIPYRFDTLNTQFQFINIIIEPHSVGTISAFSNDAHENEFFCVSVQSAPGMTECTPVGQFKIISAVNLPNYVRQLAVLTDVFTGIFSTTAHDTQRIEIITNWNSRLDSMNRFKKQANDFFRKEEEQRMLNHSNASNAPSL